MERREVIKYTAFFMGATLSASTIAALLEGCHVDQSSSWSPSFFTNNEADFVNELSETILPKTKTPGAKDALVDRFLDTVRLLRFSADENEKFKKGLDVLIAQAKADLGKDFSRASAEKRLEWVTTIDKNAYDAVKANPNMKAEEKPFYLSLKEQILGGYFSSEIVAKDFFAFDPIPGRYDPCMPYEEVGRAWA
ncbi:MAG: gluconate 2-dehydrogenase subunit 3 family protein, partial [Saprospiraceae bacterium]